MDYLPSPDQQQWLIDSLSDLVRLRGTRPFVSMPLIQPTRRFFPDPFKTPMERLDRTTRRLMQYAGLPDLDVSVGTFGDPGFDPTPEMPGAAPRSTHRVAGAFLGLRSNCAYFAYNESLPEDVEQIAGIMAHEVAHAYRERHGLVVEGTEEEFLTDVTGAFLGFGLLLTNNSYRYRARGEMVGAFSRLSWAASETGYLGAQAFAFLLAIQFEARAHDDAEIAKFTRRLEANQAAFVKSALDVVRGWPEETRRLLAFSDVGAEIEDVEPESLQAPLPDIVVEVASAPAPTPADLPNFGYPVFRVPQSAAMKLATVGLAGGFAAAIPVGMWLGSGMAAVTSLLGVFVGWQVGARRRYDLCSDPSCDSVIPSEEALCPGCGGTISGVIRSQSERLRAEEILEYRERRSRRNPKKK